MMKASKSPTQKYSSRAIKDAIVSSAQVLLGGLILGIILSTLPLLYVIFFLPYGLYTTQRERVVRGLQRNDRSKLRAVKVSQSRVRRGSIGRRPSLFCTQTFPLSNSIAKSAVDGIEVRELSNYSGTYKTKHRVKTIKNENDIVEVVSFAASTGVCIRAMGSLFSWPNIVEPGIKSGTEQTEDIVLDMKGYNRMVKTLVLPETKTQADGTVAFVTVESGMKIHQLCDLLEKLGFALPVLGNVTGQSVGGMISTGSHGKNRKHGSISSIVQSMRLVTASGEVKNIALRDSSGKCTDDPLALAVGVSMGLLGVISTVTLRVVPKYRLAYSIYDISYAKFIETYEEILEQNEQVSFIYYPFIDRIRVEQSRKLTPFEDKTISDRAVPTHSRFKLFFAVILNYILFESKFGHWFGIIIWLVIRYYTVRVKSGRASVEKPSIDKSYKMVANNVDLDIEHHEMEYAYDARSAKDVVNAYREVLRAMPPHLQYSCFLDIRFSAADSSWLAGSSGRPTVWLDLVRPNIHADTDVFMKSFKPTIVKHLGRPHFGKENILNARELHNCFPHLVDFIKVRSELDPNKVFANPYFESLLDPSAGFEDRNEPAEDATPA